MRSDRRRAGSRFSRHGEGRRSAKHRPRTRTGTLSVNRSGAGFVTPLEGGADVFIRAEDRADAVHGDLVGYRLIRHGDLARGVRPQGQVAETIAREPRRLAGIVHRHGDRLRLEPITRRYEEGPLAGRHPELRSGDRVVVLLEGGRRPGPARYRLLERLGDLSDARDDARDIAHEMGLALVFSEAAESEAAVRASETITARDRVDLRALPAVTIDPEEAADFDDAVSWRSLPGGHDEVGIHIADVARYVEPGGAVDREAVERGTSTYLPGLVLPMLPAPLSSDAASLKPALDRPALSVRAELDPEGRVVAWRLDRSLIRSRRRLTYAEAERFLAGEDPAPPASTGHPGGAPDGDEDRSWLPALRRLGAITALLRERREARGGLYLDVPEYRVRMDELGHPLDLIPRRQGVAHRLVEELMLLANELTGGWALAAHLPILFRVHERPRWEKLMEFGLVLDELGLPRHGLNLADPAVLRDVIGMAEARGVGELASMYLLRSLEKARYDAVDRGHFGLGVAGYTHFTSPIRRYPDLHTHRVLLAAAEALGDGGPRARRRADREDLLRPVRDRYRPGLEELAAAASAREVVAADAERLVMRVKALRLLAHRLGDEMSGMVTATLPAGLFVTLDEIPVDGFVARERLPADRYDLGARGHSLAGRRTGTRFALGQRVHVRIERLSVLRRELELTIVGGALEASPGEARR